LTITLEQLSKTYEGSNQPVLKDVAVQINDGEFSLSLVHPVAVKVPY
jgi:ABC-type phosphate/phosphonate transport system, ATPase component